MTVIMRSVVTAVTTMLVVTAVMAKVVITAVMTKLVITAVMANLVVTAVTMKGSLKTSSALLTARLLKIFLW